MTRQELREKSSHMRRLPLKIMVWAKNGVQYEYGDQEHYFNKEDIELGYYSHIFKKVTIFEGGRIWDKSIKARYELTKLN